MTGLEQVLSGSTSGLEACISLMPKRGVHAACRDGFPQTAACWGLPGTPACCNEALCARLFAGFSGKPPEHMLTPNKADYEKT